MGGIPKRFLENGNLSKLEERGVIGFINTNQQRKRLIFDKLSYYLISFKKSCIRDFYLLMLFIAHLPDECFLEYLRVDLGGLRECSLLANIYIV